MDHVGLLLRRLRGFLRRFLPGDLIVHGAQVGGHVLQVFLLFHEEELHQVRVAVPAHVVVQAVEIGNALRALQDLVVGKDIALRVQDIRQVHPGHLRVIVVHHVRRVVRGRDGEAQVRRLIVDHINRQGLIRAGKGEVELLHVLISHIQRPGGDRIGAGGSLLRDLCQHGGLCIVVSQVAVQHIADLLRGVEAAQAQEARIAEAVNDDRGGHAVLGDVVIQGRALVPPHGEGEIVLLLKRRDLFVCIPVVIGQGDERHLVLILLISFFQVRELTLARAAPGGPDVQQHRLMVLQGFGQGEGVALRIRGRKVHKGLAQLKAGIRGRRTEAQHQYCQDQYN